MLITYLYLLIMKEGMNSERRNEELKEGRKVSGSCAEILLTCAEILLTCAEILLTCAYLYLSKMKEGMSNERRNEELKRRKEGFWFLCQNLKDE